MRQRLWMFVAAIAILGGVSFAWTRIEAAGPSSPALRCGPAAGSGQCPKHGW